MNYRAMGLPEQAEGSDMAVFTWIGWLWCAALLLFISSIVFGGFMAVVTDGRREWRSWPWICGRLCLISACLWICGLMCLVAAWLWHAMFAYAPWGG